MKDEQKRANRLSLHPMSLDEALRRLLHPARDVDNAHKPPAPEKESKKKGRASK